MAAGPELDALDAAPIPVHLWRGIDDPILEGINEESRVAVGGQIAASPGRRAQDLLDAETFAGLMRCLREQRTIDLLDVSYLRNNGSQRFRIRHVFAAPDGALTFIRASPPDCEEIEALAAAEHKYHSLIESISAVVWKGDLETLQLTYVSRTIEQFGVTVEQALQPDFWVNWLHPEDRDWAASFCRKQIALGQDHTFEYRVVSPAGDVRWVRDIISVRGPDGKPELYGVFIDITEKRREEERRQLEHLLLGASFEASRSGMAVVTPDGQVVFHNSSLLQMFETGGDAAQLHGHPLLCTQAECAPEEVQLPNRRLARRIVTTLSGKQGEPCGHLIVLRDITEDRRRERDLRDREEHFRSLIEHSFDVITMTDREGTILYNSPAVFEALGYTPEERIGKSIFDALEPDDEPSARKAVERLLATGTPQQIVLRARHRNGSMRWFSFVYSKFDSREGLRIIANARDITERKMLETSLEQVHRTASLGHLAATIAHEMNNVLMSIQPNVEVLARFVPDDERLQRVLRVIEQSVRRGRRTTQEILRFTKPAELRLHPVDVASWLDDLCAEIVPMLGPSISLKLHLPEKPPNILGDTAALNQVLTNLLVNARDAMKGVGRIDITVAGDKDRSFDDLIEICVRDHGPGMTPDILDHIFEPMFSTKENGMGLGLAVVHQIISAHGGLIHVQSAAGRGATFHLFLLRAESAATPPVESPTQIPSGLRVLIAEDEPAIADGLSAILSLEGADIRVVNEGTNVVAAVDAFQPAVVILDVGLPDMCGTDVFAKIRERWATLPVIFSTGHADAGRLHTLLEPPLVDVVVKPYETSELLVKIHQAVELDDVKA